MNLPSHRTRWLFSIFAVGLLYVNFAVVWQPLAKYWRIPALPIPNEIAGPFRIFGMFASYETNNNEMVLWGYMENAQAGTPGWKRLRTEDHFPYKFVVQRQLLFAAQVFWSEKTNQLALAWVRSGNQIFARHNRLHPDTPISQLAFESRTWPRSPAGIYALQSPDTLQTNFWIVVTNR